MIAVNLHRLKDFIWNSNFVQRDDIGNAQLALESMCFYLPQEQRLADATACHG